MNASLTSNGHNVALITGVSSGIGRAIGQLLAERGFRVFGTARDPAAVDAIPSVELVRLDVRNEANETEVVRSLLGTAGGLHVLVNNAGYALAGALEETRIQEAQEQFDTNFFGVMRMVRAVLPTMRAQGHGRIVNISSMAGIVPLPYRGVYAASKHALEGYTEALDQEVRQFGIRAVLIEPTFTRTQLEARHRQTHESLGVYANQKQRVTDVILDQIAHGDDPRTVAEVVWHALTAQSPRLRYQVGGGVALNRLRRFAPAAIFDKQFRKRFHLDEPRSQMNEAMP
jgi:NAD(P)-dependent dehydrogenase (short-subunit alcohol dehydrogenase family)